jgi:hypothetical protein
MNIKHTKISKNKMNIVLYLGQVGSERHTTCIILLLVIMYWLSYIYCMYLALHIVCTCKCSCIMQAIEPNKPWHYT